MTEPFSTVLLERLVAASLGGAAAVGMVWIVLRLVPQIPSRIRCWLWWLASAKFLALLLLGPVVSLPLLPGGPPEAPPRHDRSSPPADVHGPPVPADGVAVSGAPNAVATPAEPAPPASAPPPLLPLPGPWLLTLVWSAGAGAFLLRLGVGAVRERRRAARLPPIEDPDLLRLFTELRRHLGTGRCDLRWDPADEAPRVVGLWNPTVVLPTGARDLSHHRLRLLLAHELLHLRRRDLWLGLVPAMARSLFFFHPFVLLAVREYRLAREAACDAAVLDRLRPNPRDYGRLLVELGATKRPMPLGAGAVASRSHLYRRLTMLQTHDRRRRWLPLLLVLPLLGVALAPVGLVAGEAPPPPEEATPAAEAPAAPEAVRASIVSAPAPAPDRPDEIAQAPARATIVHSPGSTVSSSVDSRGYAYSVSDATPEEAFVLLLEDHSFFHGSAADGEAARRHREGNEEILWYRSPEGEAWVIRDPERIAAAAKLYAPVRELGRRQAELGSRQAELGSRQAKLGGHQAELGAEQAELGKRQAELAARINELTARDLELAARKLRGDWNESLAEERRALEGQRNELQREMRSLGGSQRSLGGDQGELGARQSALGKRQSELGARQAALGAAQREASIRLEEELRRFVKEAIAAGDAERVD